MPGILCEHCTGVCCRYIALPIDKPTTRAEFDDVRWYLLHENISVFVEDGSWYISMNTPCRHLQADNRCGIYATRPRICRKYTTDNCDYHSGDYGWEQHFTCAEHLDEYVRTRGIPAENGKRNGNGQKNANGQRGGNGQAGGRKAGVNGRGKQLAAGAGGRNGQSALAARRGSARPGVPTGRRDSAGSAGAAVDSCGVPLPVLGFVR